MTVTIASELVGQILEEAAASPAVEICGLLLGEGDRITRALPCRNVATDPARRFEIDPAALIAAHRAARGGGPRIVGHYHSHPGGVAVPSARDAAEAAADGTLWLIAAGGVLRGWRAVADGPVEGRFVRIALAKSNNMNKWGTRTET
ncbi:proteasome lid subunit RPN8/RPN11 [Sphingomonas insulae]|uniref:MPN domain-containing protein n=1 Tax=Sphingomonas insulae TaxID=424800 RepID=A0ABN1HXH9_9SPHN|nr:M67 family metallopeptidase [Sphingomonas insulae]NIJ29883.1 proteasome lid subunit RPN8/RPN11 [Sphingomonas insulae]